MESALVGLGQIALGVVIIVPLVMYFAQDALIFQPHALPETQRVAIEQRLPANAQSLTIEGADGTKLHAWHLPGPPGAPLVLYFGGNAEEVSWMIDAARARAPQAGWLLVDYRGYGASGGSPSEKALTADALLWYDKFAGGRIYVFGRSLGSGVAVQVAAARPVAGVVLVAPYDSLVDVARHHYPYLPVSLLLKHRFESAEVAPKVEVPLLCLVATRDEVIPTANSHRLYEAWGGPKRWVALDGASHNGTDDHPAFWPSITPFLK